MLTCVEALLYDMREEDWVDFLNRIMKEHYWIHTKTRHSHFESQKYIQVNIYWQSSLTVSISVDHDVEEYSYTN